MNDLSVAPLAPGALSADLDSLYLHPLNTRTEPPALAIRELADSILACGLMQNLLCFVDPDRGDGSARRMGVVAGGRRLRALQLLAGAGQWSDPVPVRFTTDPLVAQVWANAENAARADLDPADEIRAYRRMAATGAPPATIARAFAVSERHVKGRLKLAHLPEPVLDALKERTVSVDQCLALTLTDDETRLAEAARRLLDDPRWHPNGIRSALTGGQVAATDRRARFVTLDLYEAEGGRTTRDLFSDAAWLHDEALLDRLFARRLDEEAERLRADGGWSFALAVASVHPHDDKRMRDYDRADPEPAVLPDADQEELERLSEQDELDDEELDRLADLDQRASGSFTDDQRAAMGIVVWVDWQGRLDSLEGLRPKAATAPADAGEGGTATAPAPAAEPDLSQALREDLLTIRRCALQTALLLKPELMLDFIAFALDWGEHHSGHGLTGLSVAVQNVHPGVADGLAIVGALQRTEGRDFDRATAAAFAAFRDGAGAKKRRNEILTIHFARSVMGIPGDLTDALEDLAGASVRAIWTPDARNCFSRMSAAALAGIYAELLEPEDGDERFAAFQAMTKRDKARELDGLFNDHAVREAYGLDRATGQRIDAWVPAIMGRGA